MGQGRSWSAAELDILATGVRAGLGYAQIAARLPGRNAKGCETKAGQLRRRGVLPPTSRACRGAVAAQPRPPRPGTSLDRLLAELGAAARRGEAMPHREDLAGRVGARDQTHISELLAELQARGLVVAEHGALGILRLSAADGSWSMAGACYAPRQVLRRQCLGCRKPFSAEHRHNFVCGGCKTHDAWTSSAAA